MKTRENGMTFHDEAPADLAAVLENDERHADNIDTRQKAENLAAFLSGKRWKK